MHVYNIIIHSSYYTTCIKTISTLATILEGKIIIIILETRWGIIIITNEQKEIKKV